MQVEVKEEVSVCIPCWGGLGVQKQSSQHLIPAEAGRVPM